MKSLWRKLKEQFPICFVQHSIKNCFKASVKPVRNHRFSERCPHTHSLCFFCFDHRHSVRDCSVILQPTKENPKCRRCYVQSISGHNVHFEDYGRPPCPFESLTTLCMYSFRIKNKIPYVLEMCRGRGLPMPETREAFAKILLVDK